MKKWKIYKIIDEDTLQDTGKVYESDVILNTSADRSHLLCPPYCEHLEVPEGQDPRHYIPSKVADPAAASYQGVTFTADNNGEAGNNIQLVFDGTDDIDTVVAAWNDANAGNTVSHNGTGTDVLAATTFNLTGGSNAGWHLEFDQTAKDAADLEDVNEQKAILKQAMEAEVYTEMATTFGTSNPDSATADERSFDLMLADPTSYSSIPVTAKVATASFAVGDALDTDQKVTDYSNEMKAKVAAYSVWRQQRIKTYLDAVAAL